jgi:hypothetical protein
MKCNVALWSPCCLIVALGLPSPADADTVQLTGGSLQMVLSVGHVDVVGERGFALTSNVNASGGFYAPRMECGAKICLPGSAVSLRATWGGSDLPGSLSFEGQVYDDLGNLNSFTSAVIDFTGSFIVPPLAPSATLTAPFIFDGLFSIPNAANTDRITHTLTGSGMATVTLSAPNGEWTADAVRYDLSAGQPIPEPGTWLMVGFGMAALLRRVSRQKNNFLRPSRPL